MAKVKFKKELLANTGFLDDLGYIFNPDYQGDFQFVKTSEEGISYYIEFQLLRWTKLLGPKRDFYVLLEREDKKETIKNFIQIPSMSLMSILKGAFSINLYTEEKLFWQYEVDSMESLEKELATIKEYLIEYGIPWLEDPTSNIDWVFKNKK